MNSSLLSYLLSISIVLLMIARLAKADEECVEGYYLDGTDGKRGHPSCVTGDDYIYGHEGSENYIQKGTNFDLFSEFMPHLNIT